ncbi:hypothetical protein [Pontibacter ruber]|uniref:PASTA domain-containing protein n=1 Tax=Pontibacter ruber TaxID=1343895 RepID=A0ABW5CSF2_9BACT|nr:hypothetical protein [Pontibacter ruber]
MKNYTLLRFLRLNLYFFLMYSLLTAIWYGITGRFSGDTSILIAEILLNAAIFSLMFSLLILVLYRRTEARIPVQKLSVKTLQQQLEEIGFTPVKQSKTQEYQVYKATPPRASALAGKVFVRKTANFYLVEGPEKYVRKVKK